MCVVVPLLISLYLYSYTYNNKLICVIPCYTLIPKHPIHKINTFLTTHNSKAKNYFIYWVSRD